MVRPNPAAQAAHSRRLASIAAAVLALFLIGCTAIYLSQPSSPSDTPPGNPPDPLAARRHPSGTPDVAPEPDALRAAVPRALDEPGVEGMESYHRGELEGALEGLRLAVEQYPEDAEARSALGQVLAGLGHLDEAVSHLEGAVALNPGRPAYRANLGRALAQLRRWDEAIASYRRAQALFPDDPDITLALAEALHHSGQKTPAVDEDEKAIALNPGNP